MSDGDVERYDCKPDECQPDARRDPKALGAEWSEQSKTWAWTCPHGRLYYMSWHGVISLSELREAIGLRRERLVTHADLGRIFSGPDE